MSGYLQSAEFLGLVTRDFSVYKFGQKELS